MQQKSPALHQAGLFIDFQATSGASREGRERNWASGGVAEYTDLCAGTGQ